MKIPIREQLVILLTCAVCVALAIVSVPTWIYVKQLVTQIEQDGLALTASLKATRIAAEIIGLQQNCLTISSRLLIQEDMVAFYTTNNRSIFSNAIQDLSSALSAGGSTTLLQARIYSRNSTGAGRPLVEVTSPIAPTIKLPYLAPDGSVLYFSNLTDGYPAILYPNITYVNLHFPNPYDPRTPAFVAQPFPGINVTKTSGMLLGPLIINTTFALLSLTIPIQSNTVLGFVLGYMTILAQASSFIRIRDSREGLGDTGLVLLAGPNTPYNRFSMIDPPSNATFLTPDVDEFGHFDVHLIMPPVALPGQESRHQNDGDDISFHASDYPAVLSAFTEYNPVPNNATAYLSTTNELGIAVAVGSARVATNIVDWTVLVEQTLAEANQPIWTLRDILLATVFGTLGTLLLLTFPCAHFSVRPIRRLKDATEKSMQPPGIEGDVYDTDGQETQASGNASSRSEKRMLSGFRKLFRLPEKPNTPAENDGDHVRRTFKIPGRVEDRRHFITDELTELTRTFNDVSDELHKQYTRLDEKVAERTCELEISKKAAEAANESKTLFIANISHELKTPLNGILGMCAICMEEPDIGRIKHYLNTLYKSGDLLLHLLEDLLSFSKNQIGQQLSLEENEFKLSDVRSQILIIFDQQVREGRINFSVTFASTESQAQDLDARPDNSKSNSYGSGNSAIPVSNLSVEPKLPAVALPGIGRLKDMCVWGDQHRILQVIINLVSNSLKFTPSGGKVSVRIRCLGEADRYLDEQNKSSSTWTVNPRSRLRVRGGSSTHSNNSRVASSVASQIKNGTAVAINPMEPRLPMQSNMHCYERSPTPPPISAKLYMFEFEVEDTGPGIPDHMKQRVFEPFVQGDLGLDKKFGGTGLGLSICHQLATLLGGSIALRSTVDVGTTFTMRIPLKYVRERTCSTSSSLRSPSLDIAADGDANATHARPNASPSINGPQPRLVGLRVPFFATNLVPAPATADDQMAALETAREQKAVPGKLRVLVADDNNTNIEVVSRMLKLEDVYDVTIAKDGQEAHDLVKAAMAKSQRFDLIFMDIQMPNLDGLQSTRLIRQMGYDSPIVALTAFSDESNVKQCLESGMNEFLSKPIRRPALKKVLQKFATIPEEPDTNSVSTRKDTPDAFAAAANPDGPPLSPLLLPSSSPPPSPSASDPAAALGTPNLTLSRAV